MSQKKFYFVQMCLHIQKKNSLAVFLPPRVLRAKRKKLLTKKPQINAKTKNNSHVYFQAIKL